MRLRSSPSILRIHSSKKKKGEESTYSELLLFYPWRKERDLREKCIELFNDNFEVIKNNKESIYPNSSMIDVLRELIENPEDARPIHLNDLDTAGEQENIDDMTDLEPLDMTVLSEDESDTVPKNVTSTGIFSKPITVDENDVMLEYARSLSFEQRVVF